MTDPITAARQVIRDWCSNEMLPGDYAELTRLIAEAALAAAQKRIAELERTLEKIAGLGDVNADEAPGMARAALAGGTAGDGEREAPISP